MTVIWAIEGQSFMQLTAMLPYMTQDAIPELEINEIRHSEMIMQVFERVERIQAQIDVLHTEAPESRLGTDHKQLSSFPVAGYVHTQTSVAAGCIAALKQMIVRETDDTATMTASPFGAYALIRNSIDAAAVGLWIAEPESSTGRIKRRLQAQVDETKNAAAFRQSTGQTTSNEWRDRKRMRLSEVAGLAIPGDWDLFSSRNKMPSMTEILKSLERHHQDPLMPWLSAWQLSSGHAHAKVWAALASHELSVIEGAQSEVGLYRMSIKYGILAALLLEAMKLLEVTARRYAELATSPDSERQP